MSFNKELTFNVTSLELGYGELVFFMLFYELSSYLDVYHLQQTLFK